MISEYTQAHKLSATFNTWEEIHGKSLDFLNIMIQIRLRFS